MIFCLKNVHTPNISKLQKIAKISKLRKYDR